MAIEKNSVVSMFYELKDANTNEVLESNLYSLPISFILVKGQILESLEEEVMKQAEELESLKAQLLEAQQ